MKKIILSIVLLFGTSAMACPDLSGKWLCKENGQKSSRVKVEQSVNKDGYTVYTTTDLDNSNAVAESIIADGQFHITEQDQDYVIKQKATCASSTQLDGDFLLTWGGQIWRSTMSITKTSSGMKVEGVQIDPDGTKQYFGELCTQI